MLTLDVEVKVGNKRKIEGKCKSTDTKPTDIINGSLLIEVGTDANTLEESVRSGQMLGNALAAVLQNK